MTLQVAMLIHDYFPRVGGAQALLRSQASLLKARGVNVTILTRRFPATLAFEEIDGIPVYRLPMLPLKPAASIAYTIFAANLLRRLRPDVIHANEFISPATTALLAKRLFDIPIVVTPHRSGPLGDVQRLQTRRGGPSRLKALREQADAFVVISKDIDTELSGIEIPPEKMHSINNGVDTTRFSPVEIARKIAIRESMNIPADAVVVIYTGRLAREKRLDTLLTAWSALRSHFPKAELLLLGAGDQESKLRAMAGAGIRFLGSQSDVLPYLQAADIFVLPSEAEGLSISMLEAMSCGLAPVLTRVGGALEVISDEKNGLLIPPGDAHALQNALTKLLEDAALRSQIGFAARQRIVEEYSLESSVEKLLHLYHQLAKHPKSSEKNIP
jgi:glycosyltransferase involved in cell wall biosynthesis